MKKDKKAPKHFEDPLNKRIGVGLTKVALALKHQGWQGATSRGLSPTQGQILALIAGAVDGLRPSTIAEQLAVRAPTVTDSVRALVDKQLVEKVADVTDARATRLRLTLEGKSEARKAAGWPDFLVTAVDSMNADEQETFFQGLLKMIRTLQVREQIPVSQMCLTCIHFQPSVHDGDRPHHCAFVDAAFGNRHLRLSCADHQTASSFAQESNWAAFQSIR